MANDIEGILPKGTIYKFEASLTIQDKDPKTGDWTSKVYPAGTDARILKYQLKQEATYKYVDYVVEMPDGYVMNVSSRQVHRKLGLPAPKIKKKCL